MKQNLHSNSSIKWHHLYWIRASWGSTTCECPRSHQTSFVQTCSRYWEI